ncbi:UNVERIFIED_CONTAM: DUF45 domain-containing protein [Campylobacter lari]
MVKTTINLKKLFNENKTVFFGKEIKIKYNYVSTRLKTYYIDYNDNILVILINEKYKNDKKYKFQYFKEIIKEQLDKYIHDKHYEIGVLVNIYLDYHYTTQKNSYARYVYKKASKIENNNYIIEYQARHINYSLIMIPLRKELIDHIILHEHIHHFHKNHRKEFNQKGLSFNKDFEKLEKEISETAVLI